MMKSPLKYVLMILLAFVPGLIFSQITTSSISGSVKNEKGEAMAGATITATHLPTGSVYKAISRDGGLFNINNMNPGGPYTIEISYVNFPTDKRTDVYLTLGESYAINALLSTRATELSAVVVSGIRKNAEFGAKGGTETTIGRDKMATLPTVGRNIFDYLRSVPQARVSNSMEGAVSIAGQNNRFNAFYVDGAVNNDVFGLSNSGSNGGQAALSPLSIDAIDQFQVVVSPYDASLGNFTGGGINAITKSGTNKTEGSIYYFMRNQDLTGKTPTGSKSLSTKLAAFKNQTYGFRLGGALIRNKLFYFVNAESQRDQRPQPFDPSIYGGVTKTDAALTDLTNVFQTRYGYDIGGYRANDEKVMADRITVKVDWTINEKNKLTISNRYTNGERVNTSVGNSTAINFYNNAYKFPTRTNSTSLELKSSVGKSSSNRLLLTYTDVLDDRNPLGASFPRINIFEGTGTGSSNGLIIGPDISSTQNLLTQKNWNLVDAFKFNLGKHALTAGVDAELNDVYNVFIQRSFGEYMYDSLGQFLRDMRPRQFRVGYPLVDDKRNDETGAAAKFKVGKLSMFLNDEIHPVDNVTISMGLRLDTYSFITNPTTDPFTNDSALSKFSQYYDLKGARSGQKPNIPVSLSPRLGITYKIPEENITIRGGVGLFTGRIPLVWPGGIYNNNGLFVGGFTVNSGTNAAAWNTIRFRPDINKQWTAAELGINLTKGPLNLVSKQFRMPKLLRTSLAVDKVLGDGWRVSVEGLVSKNVNEITYTNINILPPIGSSVGAGSRLVYPTAINIPIRANGSNPYDAAILLSNNSGKKGFSYNLVATVDKRFTNGFNFSVNYSYGSSQILNESTSSVNTSQWQFMESVNGRNNMGLSTSDFDQGHRIFAYASKKFTYAKKRLSTTISLVYTGQSGSPISYVYGGAIVRDDPSGGNDLLYIPTSSELQSQTFLSNTIGTGAAAVTYTPDQQKTALDNYIMGDKYLSKHRGEFSARNGARLPFTNIIDLKIAQDVNLKVGKNMYSFQITYDMFNFTNFLNRDWGRTFFQNNDNFALVTFSGYVSPSNLTPQYKYNPAIKTPYNVSTSTVPSFAARWVSQLGLRFNF
ncbi:MAG: carboxypeptidase regulatory-like domain-containing protein [Chitinophagaceae bacterium]